MRRVRLGTLLIGLNTGLVLLAVAGLSVAAVRLLGRLADEQALARVSLAGRSALLAVERSAGDVSTSAHLLGERPTVGRLLEAHDLAGLTAFLDRFRATSRLSGCAVFVQGKLTAASGAPEDWAGLLRAGQAAKTAPALVRADPKMNAGELIFTASSPLQFFPDGVAVTALHLDADFVREVSRQVGLPVAIVPAAEQEAERPGVYLSSLPLRDPPVAIVETSLSRAPIAASLKRLERAVFFAALLVAAVACFSGLLISRRLTGPVRSLTTAAARIGRGDLATPIPKVQIADLGTLAATMEETRRRLLRLTSELRRRQAEGEAILTGISEGVLSVDRDRRIRYLNPQAAELLGVRAEDALGRFCGDVLKPVAVHGVRPCEEHCPILHARFRGATRATERLHQADGTQRVVVINSAAPAEEQQFLVLSDETEAEAARRLRDAVLANISHEFKTPLAAQRASIELLRERLLDATEPAPETQSLVLSLERGGLRLTQLIDNLLESVRIEAGQTSIRSRPVALDEVVEEAVEMTEPLLAQRGQTLAVELPYPLPAVAGDAPRLIQVFVNLLANANKFAPAGSTVRIGGDVQSEAVCLWVEDEGPGVPEDTGEAGSLFERFVRAPGREEEPEQSGMGLGLWIVQSIVERHGGTVEARREGAGTRIRVTLPAAEESETA
ncbi:MAG TPA: ATP-binding protein [Thermoanaerobaculia bacterium]|jgi:signal transduction histidine kinase|nr:ATP-binding protein [Thermoanaerobaculia bacterium]